MTTVALATAVVMGATVLVSTAVAGLDPEECKEIMQAAVDDGVVKENPFSPIGKEWEEWAWYHKDFLSYRSDCIRRWETVAEVTNMDDEQRAKAKELHAKSRRLHEAHDADTTPPRRKLKKRAKEAREAGDSELARKLDKLCAVQAVQKISIQGNASAELLKLLTPEQRKLWHEYKVIKVATKHINGRVTSREISDEKLVNLVKLSDDQRDRIREMARKLAKTELLPTVEKPEDLSGRGLGRGELAKRATTLANEKLYPEVVKTVLTDEQRAKLEAAQLEGTAK
jgi:Spy/CpxP family protein refolding chaperone